MVKLIAIVKKSIGGKKDGDHEEEQQSKIGAKLAELITQKVLLHSLPISPLFEPPFVFEPLGDHHCRPHAHCVIPPRLDWQRPRLELRRRSPKRRRSSIVRSCWNPL